MARMDDRWIAAADKVNASMSQVLEFLAARLVRENRISASALHEIAERLGSTTVEHHLAEIERQVASNPALASAFVQFRQIVKMSK